MNDFRFHFDISFTDAFFLLFSFIDVQINCKDETIMSNSIEEKEVCFDVAKTECKETTESVDTEFCTYTYEDMEVVQPAKTIEVKFEKKCQTQMVTVCEPGKI